ELGVEQAKAAISKPGHQINECHLAGIGFEGEHALAEECASERYPVQTAIQPSLHGVAIAHLEKFGVKLADTLVDPGGAPPSPRGGTPLDHSFIRTID